MILYYTLFVCNEFTTSSTSSNLEKYSSDMYDEYKYANAKTIRFSNHDSN